MNENQIGNIVVEKSILIHRELGPGLLESVYEKVLAWHLTASGLQVACQHPIAITYCGIFIEEAFRADIVVNDLVILELKSVEEISKSHFKQLNTYLRLSNKKLGYLLNFGSYLMKDGIVRVANGL